MKLEIDFGQLGTPENITSNGKAIPVFQNFLFHQLPIGFAMFNASEPLKAEVSINEELTEHIEKCGVFDLAVAGEVQEREGNIIKKFSITSLTIKFKNGI